MYRELVIDRVIEEVSDVKTVTFTGESTTGITYHAGQYLTLVMKSGDSEIRRSYSIVSSPALNEPLAICVKRIENGVFSRYLVDDAKPGDRLLTSGTGGFFTLPGDLENYKQVFFFAGGSGIAPIMSLLKTVLLEQPRLKVVLIYSSRSKSNTIYYDKLESLASQYPALHIEYMLSNSKYLSTARLHQQLLRRMLQKLAIADPGKILFYICGPFAYMRMITFTLTEEHVPAANIRKENFNAAKPVVFYEPPDKEAHQVRVQYDSKVFSFRSQYPDTILKAAQKQGFSLPYSCEVGRCGNCVARCTKGKVWMSYNEVLTDKEIANGLVLTCTGYPVSGDVELEI